MPILPTSCSRPGHIEVAAPGGGQRQLLGDADRDPRDALGVARSIGVLRVDGRGQRPDDPEEQALELGVDPGVGELGLDERRDVLEAFDLRRREGAVLGRVDRDEPPGRAGGDPGVPADGIGGMLRDRRPGLDLVMHHGPVAVPRLRQGAVRRRFQPFDGPGDDDRLARFPGHPRDGFDPER